MVYNAPVKRFPLLRAPWLVIEAVITTMTPHEIIHLSHCSKRVRALIVYFTRRQQYCLHFKAEQVLSVSLNFPKTHDYFRFKFNNDILHYYLGYDCVWHGKRRAHLSDQLHVIKALIAELTYLYTIHFHIAELHLDYWESDHPELLYDWLNSFGTRIRHARVYGNSISGVGFQKFVGNFKFSRTTCIHVPQQIEPIDCKLNMTCEDLHIDSADWVTLTHLLNMKSCVTMRLGGLGLSDEGLNHFLKCLMRGHLPKLEFIEICLGGAYDGETVMKGIEMYHEDSGRVFRRRHIEQLDEGGHYFQLDNGEIATIFFYPNEMNVDAVSDSLGIVIWRNNSVHIR